MPITSSQLAAEIVRRASVKGHMVSNLSLQKLAYFCHGWHLGIFGSDLVDETFEAWRYGPVLPTLYHTFKAFGSSPIPASHPLISAAPPVLDANAASLIDRVIDVYGPYSTAQLVELSHRSDGPWREAFDLTPNFGQIQNSKIRDYFARLKK